MKEIKLIKPRSKYTIWFKPSEPDDDWFVWILYTEKTGKVTKKSMIIQKDVDDFLTHYLNNGWQIATEETETVKKPSKPKKTK